MDKHQLRKQFIEIRSALDLGAVETWSKDVTDTLKKRIFWPSVRRIHVYDSSEDWNEVSTKPLIEFIKDSHPGIELIIGPVSRSAPFPSGTFDVVIVPLVAFDRTLNRLGFGGGWYDKFLSTQPKAFKIGLAFDAQRADAIPSEQFDVVLDMVVTDRNVYEIGIPPVTAMISPVT